jgi:hypothetical protein
LRDYSKKNGCNSESPIYRNKYTINKKDQLFIDYAENIKKMIQNASNNQSKLLSVINELFTYIIDPYTNKKVIRINPKLTEDTLQKQIEKTRKLIVDLYVKCEMDYVNGVKLYEAIVESKILETTEKQIETLKNESSKIIDETNKLTAPEKPEIIVKPQQPPVFIAEGPSQMEEDESIGIVNISQTKRKFPQDFLQQYNLQIEYFKNEDYWIWPYVKTKECGESLFYDDVRSEEGSIEHGFSYFEYFIKVGF